MLNCREVTRLHAADEIEEQDLRTRFQVWLHLMMCRHCRDYVEQIRQIGLQARGIFGWSGTRQEQETLQRLEERILDREA